MCLAAVKLNEICAATKLPLSVQLHQSHSSAGLSCVTHSQVVGRVVYVRPPLLCTIAARPRQVLTQCHAWCEVILVLSYLSVFLFPLSVLAAYDAFARARVPQCQLHL